MILSNIFRLILTQFVGFTFIDSIEVPVLRKGHAQMGIYPFMDMQNCGYMNPNQVVKTKIIGGTPAVLGEFPWQVAIHYKNASLSLIRDTFICGGALINVDWVLASNHCLKSTDLSSDLKVYLGSLNRYDFHNMHSVSNIVRHPQFDLMLLKLSTPSLPVKMADYYVINTICLPKPRIMNNLSEDALLSGWGYTDTTAQTMSLTLQKATYLIKPYSECLDISQLEVKRKPLGFEEICSIETQHMFCMGDSGSPLIQFDGRRAVIIGTVESHTTYNKEKCGPGVYIFIRVSFFIDWIVHNITPQPAPAKEDLDTSTQGTLSNYRPQLILTLICFYAKFYFY